ncbi:hypothetical protein ABZ353_10780 [Streptomyces niveus]|uniref:hypothetical protein n=1 Tax=Streptomyces niveus TaxID=193462 RepID=UPI0034028570
MKEPQLSDTVFVAGKPFRILAFSEDYGTYLSNGQWVCASQFVSVTGAAWRYEPEEKKDTLAAWLYHRFSGRVWTAQLSWEFLSQDDKDYWEHEAKAVRRAVARGGFKEPQ